MSIIFDATTAEQAISTMQAYGGTFIKQLAHLWCLADPVNRGRLQLAFRAEFDKYAEDAKILKHYQGMAREAELAARN
ncbi:MAG: hypothetical protein ACN6PJ_30425 [Achromobacter sp.]|uniref:hypothetical protein n=1 Tax=unclassified Achromobacter TaxID=2626865 RepID=UPI00177F4DF3|nr:hypothetical protein [Achromobacter sp. ACM01]MBD9476467.1 hypothetical protein [Achromobacter sp. ACM01]